MFLFLMITFRIQNRSFKFEWFKWFPWPCFSYSKDLQYHLLFGLCFIWSKVSRKEIFIPKLLSPSYLQSQPVKYMLKGRKKGDDSSEQRKSLHGKTWSILSDIMAHSKGSGEEIVVMYVRTLIKEFKKIATSSTQLLTH